MVDENPARLAVLIDADNARPSITEGLLAEVAKYGTAHVKRAYGDWTGTSLKGWKDQLLAQSIQPIQQFAYTTGKNATDTAMVIDAMDLLYSGRFDGFCIVSSDSDFTRLAARLRESGLTVYGFGERKTPKPFVAACDKFIYIENLTYSESETTPAGAASSRRRATTAAQLKRDAGLVGQLRHAVEAASDDDGWAQLAIGGPHHDQAAARLRLAQLRLRQAQRPRDRVEPVRARPPQLGRGQASGALRAGHASSGQEAEGELLAEELGQVFQVGRHAGVVATRSPVAVPVRAPLGGPGHERRGQALGRCCLQVVVVRGDQHDLRRGQAEQLDRAG